jgi:hypothetical protein
LQTCRIQVADSPDYLRTIRPLAKICQDLDIPYALSGSLASSLYGLQRATLQIDFIAGLGQKHLPSFCTQLSGLYLLHKEEIEAAIRQKSCFTLVHLESLLKVIITLPAMLTIGQQIFHRVRKITLVEGEEPVPVLSPEQMILLLLEAFKRSNERADDLWYDLLGMVKVQGTDLDMSILTRQAADLGVTELLARALIDAGLGNA